MSEQFEHLTLPSLPSDFFRKKRSGGFGYSRGNRSKSEFSSDILQSFSNIQANHEKAKERYKGFVDPHLIFKIDINQNVYEDGFKDELRRSGIEVISPSPDNKGYWIVFSNDDNLLSFKQKLQKYVEEDRYKYIDAIGDLLDIPPEEKIGKNLINNPLYDGEFPYLDIEIWRMETNKLDSFLTQFTRLIINKNGKLSDIFTTNSFCLARVQVNKELYDDIINLREVACVDRPPKMKIESSLSVDVENINIAGEPPEDSAGILVIDSGILSSHPLLENAVGEAISVSTKNSSQVVEEEPYDDVGHGTRVAGVALYGNIQKCIDERLFIPKAWIFSAKVLFKDEDGYATFDEQELLEHQLYSAIVRIVESYPNCKVVNLSFGDSSKRMFGAKRQFNLASLVDEMAKEFDIAFVISIGNVYPDEIPLDGTFDISYPNYLLDESSDLHKLIDPSTAALALTVGALSSRRISTLFEEYVDYPSPTTRVGLGYKGMIKPELVENGGGGFGEESNVVTLNPKWIEEGRLFTMDSGTSYSAPVISNYIAMLATKYPNASMNLIKALLLSSATIPLNRPEPLSTFDIGNSPTNEIKNVLKVYGYGKPNLEKALFSESNRVLLINENKLKLNRFHVYTIDLPSDYIEKRGEKSIVVTLVFNPPTNKNRIEYLGAKFETHIFKNVTYDEVISAYSPIDIEKETEEEIVPLNIKNKEIKLSPGTNLRKKGVHQKGIKKYTSKPQIETDKPLILVVICQDVWIKNESYEQEYSVIVSIEHASEIDLYNQIRLKNRERLSIAVGY